MENTLVIALAKLLDKQIADLKPGQYRIDQTVTLRIAAEIKRSEDTTYVPTTSVPLKMTLAILLDRMGFQRDKAMEMLVSCMDAAIQAEQSASKVMEEHIRNIDNAMSRVESVCAALPVKVRKGPTNVKGTVTLVTDLPDAA
jgi:hypothetical protein